MRVFFRIVAVLLLVAAIIAVCGGLYKMYTGNYFYNASFITSAIVVLIAVVAIFLMVRGVILLIKRENKT